MECTLYALLFMSYLRYARTYQHSHCLEPTLEYLLAYPIPRIFSIGLLPYTFRQ